MCRPALALDRAISAVQPLRYEPRACKFLHRDSMGTTVTSLSTQPLYAASCRRTSFVCGDSVVTPPLVMPPSLHHLSSVEYPAPFSLHSRAKVKALCTPHGSLPMLPLFFSSSTHPFGSASHARVSCPKQALLFKTLLMPVSPFL